jgi:acyl-CoA hydrolase
MSKTRSSTKVTTRKIVSGEHLNPNGTLFGGHLMSWMDEVAFICARRFTGKPTCVTVNIDSVTFKTPIHLGEHLVLTSMINHVGASSMEIQVIVEREDSVTQEMFQTNSAHLTFVCLNQNSKPQRVPRLILESDEDRVRNRESLLRLQIRKRFKNFLAKRNLSPFDLVKSSESEKSSILNHTIKYRLNKFASRIGLSVIHALKAF